MEVALDLFEQVPDSKAAAESAIDHLDHLVANINRYYEVCRRESNPTPVATEENPPKSAN